MSMTNCPHCGADIKTDADFCRHCGSSESDGWREDAEDGSFEDDFDYDEFVDEHFSDRVTNTKVSPLWRLVAIVLLILFVSWAVFAF